MFPGRRTTQVLFLSAATAMLFGCPASLLGLNFELRYYTERPDWPPDDPGGTKLKPIVQYVASVYEDIFEDRFSLTLNYGYGGTIPSLQGFAYHDNPGYSGGREFEGYLTVNVNAGGYGWFYDPTPADDSEFHMAQTLWRDLTPEWMSGYFNVGPDIPATFEVGYGGIGNGSDPNTAGHADLLSHVFRAVGHALGMCGGNFLPNETNCYLETLDGDFDFDSVNIFGKTLAAQCDANDGYGNATLYDHFAVTAWYSNFMTDMRRRPSHTDLLCMAAVDNFSQLDFPRREYYGGTYWHTAANWSGNTVPGSGDDAFVRSSGPGGEFRTALLSANAYARNLTIAEGSNVDVQSYRLTVIGTTIADGPGTDLVIDTGGTFDSGTLISRNEAAVRLFGGQLSVGTFDNNASVVGHGTVTIAYAMVNRGSIVASTDTLLVQATGDASLDLDGVVSLPAGIEWGKLIATAANSDLIIDGPLSDSFNGTATVGDGNRLRFDEAWTLGGQPGGSIIFGSDGVLNLSGGNTRGTSAILAGATFTVEGDLNVGSSNYGLIYAPVVFSSANGGAAVVCNGTLELNGGVTYQGGWHTGAGRLIWDGAVHVTGDTTIGVAELDAFATLTIDSLTTLTKTGSGTWNINGPQSHWPHSNMTISGGAVVMNSDAGAMGRHLTVNVRSGSQVRFSVTQHLAGLIVGPDSTAIVRGGGDSVLVTDALSIGVDGGAVDLFDNDLILDYTGASPVGVIRNYLVSGYNGGLWDGYGIRTSSGSSTRGLGYADNTVLGLASFSGQSVDATSVLVKYTYYGDANLDGKVDITDLGVFATHWQSSGVWTSGDSSYDGFIDITDLGLLATNWQAGVGNPLGSSFDEALASFGWPGMCVPEPARGVLLVVASLLAFRPAAVLRRDVSYRRPRID